MNGIPIESELFDGWARLCAASARLAARAASGADVAAAEREALRAALSAQVQCTRESQSAQLRAFTCNFQLSDEEHLAAWLLLASQISRPLQRELEVLSGDAEITCGGLAAAAFTSSPLAALQPLSRSGTLVRYGWIELAEARTSWTKTVIRPSERLLGLLAGTTWPMDLPGPVDRQVKHGFIGRSGAVEEMRAALACALSIIIVAGLPNMGRRTRRTRNKDRRGSPARPAGDVAHQAHQ